MATETDLLGRGLAVVDGDLVLGDDGLATVEGRACLHQNLGHRLVSRPGELVWDPTAGIPLALYVEADMDSLALRRLELAAADELERDRRVDATGLTVRATQLDADTVTLEVYVRPIDGFDPLALVVPLEAA